MISKDRKLRKERWARIFEYYGGRKCSKCGIESEYPIYDLHHRDPSLKEFKISRAIRHKWETLLAEIEKCDLLCANCHRIVHEEEKELQDLNNLIRTLDD